MTEPTFDLPKILEDHALWLRGEGGAHANLSGANLSDANLSDAYLSDAYLADAQGRAAGSGGGVTS